MSVFAVEIGGVFELDVDQIWPDKDAPDNPSTFDVIQQMKKAGSVALLAREWNLEPLEVVVARGAETSRWRR